IVAHPKLQYVTVPNPRDRGEQLIVARALLETVVAQIARERAAAGQPIDAAALVAEAQDIPEAEMRALEGTRYRHPFITKAVRDADWRLWFADYVTADAGTGLVHTAPGHGADDYRTGVAHGLPP